MPEQPLVWSDQNWGGQAAVCEKSASGEVPPVFPNKEDYFLLAGEAAASDSPAGLGSMKFSFEFLRITHLKSAPRISRC